MNVVGKVGSLITQGVYSVATPFHPFGGAVDIIVVQQQDGSFRSTPWYVQFGKFQGVLKGAEKVVRINVNGVEADFHMYLDNSGEAYFVREAESGQDVDQIRDSADEKTFEHSFSIDNSQCITNGDNVENFRLQSTLSDPGVLRDDFPSFRPDLLERTDSDVCRFYDFQDDQSFEGELPSEYGSSRFDNMDALDNFVEAQDSDSEMVLVSVDGHILTAPISSSEQNTEDVQLVTPQFHLGPGEGNDFSEGDREFTITGSTWDIRDLGASSSKLESVVTSSVDIHDSNMHSRESPDGNYGDGEPSHQKQVCDHLSQSEPHCEVKSSICTSESCEDEDELGEKVNVLKSSETHGDSESQVEEYGIMHQLEILENKEKHVLEGHQVDGMHHRESWEDEKVDVHQDLVDSIKNQERDVHFLSDVKCTPPSVKNERYKSCLDLTAAADETSESDNSTLGEQEVISLVEKSSPTVGVSNTTDVEYTPEGASTETKVVIDTNVGSMAEVKTDGELSLTASDSVTSTSSPISSQASERFGRVHTSVGDSDTHSRTMGNASNYKDETARESLERDTLETNSNKSEVLNPHTRSSSKEGQARLNSTLDISLCRHLLRPGMGLEAAEEAFNSHRISEEEFRSTAVSVIKNDNLVLRYKGKYFAWDQAAPIVLGIAVFGLDLSIESNDAIPVEQKLTPELEKNDAGSASGRRWRLWPNPFRRVKTVQHSNSSSSEEVFLDSESLSHNPSVHQTPTSQSGTPRSATSIKSPHKKIVRTNIPTNEQIESLKLREGQNDVKFSFSTRVLGLQQVEAHIYLWKWNARIVISDVDGTITKSDVLGQFMPLVGKDWSQSGVARLFSAIKENGYQLLFLSARAIVQAYLTKSFLFNLKQDGKTLPNGPVVISPNGLFPSLFREVIRRAPHEFKIACLEDIKALFPPDYNPFYAGFGNRDTDELTYRKIGIPKGKVFIINPKGEVAINHRIDVKSYTSLHTLVNDMFPPTSMAEQEDYNSWNYWKMPLPDIDG